MLKEILTVAGKSGLFRLVARGRNSLILEPIVDGEGKRFPVQGTDKVVSLGDISIFTDEGELSLREVFLKIEEKVGKQAVNLDVRKASAQELTSFFASVVPDYDRDRFYVSHMKKVLTWYNFLVEAGQNDFSEEAPAEEPAAEAPAAE